MQKELVHIPYMTNACMYIIHSLATHCLLSRSLCLSRRHTDAVNAHACLEWHSVHINFVLNACALFSSQPSMREPGCPHPTTPASLFLSSYRRSLLASAIISFVYYSLYSLQFCRYCSRMLLNIRMCVHTFWSHETDPLSLSHTTACALWVSHTSSAIALHRTVYLAHKCVRQTLDYIPYCAHIVCGQMRIFPMLICRLRRANAFGRLTSIASIIKSLHSICRYLSIKSSFLPFNRMAVIRPA